MTEITLTAEQCDLAKEYLRQRVVVDENGCHNWTLYKNKLGYAPIKFWDKTVYAHRLSAAAHNGGVLKSRTDTGKRLIVRHLCNNPSCVRAEHLLIGTDSENKEDMRKAGTLSQGAKNGHAKLNDEIVLQVIASKGSDTVKNRATHFGVSSATIRNIDMNRRWTHLARPDGILPVRQNIKRSGVTEWTPEKFNEGFEKVMKECQYMTENNRWTGTPCLIWTGKTHPQSGRGWIRMHSMKYAAQEIACQFGEQRVRPKGLVVRHLCGVALCCNPGHPKFDTYHENALDQIRLGEQKTKLNEETVREIRQIARMGAVTQTAIAKRFEISKATVSRIVNNKRWKHVDSQIE